MALNSTSQLVIIRNGTHIVGRAIDMSLQVGDMIPVFNYGSGSVVFDSINTVEIFPLPSGSTMIEMSVNNGSIVTGTSALTVMIYQSGSYTFPSIESISPGTFCPVSLLLPTRLGQQVTGGLNISVQMIQNMHDPMIQIPVTTNTWGDLVIQYADISKFISATSDQSDKDTLQMIGSANVQFSPVTFVGPALSEVPSIIKITTLSGLPFMLSNGIFVQCS